MAALDFPTSPTNGQFYQGYVWNASNGTWDSSYQADTLKPGLTQIIPPTVSISGGTATANSLGTISFTAATSISLNNVFSSTYNAYRVLLYVPSTATASGGINLRYRVGGADNSSALYTASVGLARSTGTLQNNSGAGTTAMGLGAFVASADNIISAVLDIHAPNLASRTLGNFMYHGSDATSAMGYYGSFYHSSNISFDGFTLYTSAGNITGTVSVYGYAI